MPLCGRIHDFQVSYQDGIASVLVRISMLAVEIGFANIIESALSRLDTRFNLNPIRVMTGTSDPLRFRTAGDDPITQFLELMRNSVTIEDDADESHALAVHYLPDVGEYTEVGRMVHLAKSYDMESGDEQLASQVSRRFRHWIERHPRYSTADLIAPIPPSNLAKKFDFPSLIGSDLASQFGKPLIRIQSMNTTPQKDLPDDAPDTISGAFRISQDLTGKTVLVIDDLYDRGRTMNEAVRALKSAAASTILTLAATKTATNCSGMAPNESNWRV